MADPDDESQVANWQTFIRPVLEVVLDGQVWKTKDLKAAVIDHVGLSEAQRAIRLKTGGGQAENRIGWALSALRRATAIKSARTGFSQITELGRNLLGEYPGPITEADLETIPAYRTYVPKKRSTTSPAIDIEQLPSFWFVGAYYSDPGIHEGEIGDQTASFVEEGRWVNDNPDRYLDVVKEMKAGERIAIKAAYTRKYDVPFDTKGNRVAVMAIKATGTITKNHGDGRNIDVDWDPPQPVREWYFYANQHTVWRVRPADWKSQALIAFTFDDADQDYDEFRNAPYWSERFGDEAQPIAEDDQSDEETIEEETAATPSYGIGDIVADGCFLPEATLRRYLAALERKKSLILQGPPGTGKTWLAKRLARALIGQDPTDLLQSTQFHPTLSYEDFVRGWRPDANGTLTLTDGLFLELIKKAEATPGNRFVLVIEEINRGNIAQIFGELLTLLEADKRTPTEALTLTYRRHGEEPIYIPDNLYVIGTMNLADRSLAIVDFALRRRFAFADLTPQFNERWQAWVAKRNSVPSGVLAILAQRIGVLNQRISDDRSLGEQYCIGHSYFTPAHTNTIDDPARWIRDIIEYELRPLLAEYWFDDPARIETEAAELIGTP